MNFDLNAKPSPQRRPARRPAPAPAPAAKLPSTASVPISVYRELSAELQATQAMLDSLHGQNQHLRKQNLHLQQEVDSIVQAAQKMQHMVGGPNPVPSNQGYGQYGFQNLPLDASEAMAHAVRQTPEVPPQLRRAAQQHPGHAAYPRPTMPPRVSEPPQAQEMPIMPDVIEPLPLRQVEALSNPGLVPGRTPDLNPLNPQQAMSSSGGASKRQLAMETLNKIFTGREQPLPRHNSLEESSEEIHTGWLVLIVLLIVVTAFGTGFMIVRPFLSNNR
jgi:hypothetical protein